MTADNAHPPWLSQGKISVLGSGAALPGEAVDTDTLIAMLEERFGLTLWIYLKANPATY